MTAKGLNSKHLLHQEQELRLPSLMNKEAIEIGQLASELGRERKLPIAIEVRIGDFMATLPLHGTGKNSTIAARVSTFAAIHAPEQST